MPRCRATVWRCRASNATRTTRALDGCRSAPLQATRSPRSVGARATPLEVPLDRRADPAPHLAGLHFGEGREAQHIAHEHEAEELSRDETGAALDLIDVDGAHELAQHDVDERISHHPGRAVVDHGGAEHADEM